MNPRNLAVYRFSRPAVSTTHTPLQLRRRRVAGIRRLLLLYQTSGFCVGCVSKPLNRRFVGGNDPTCYFCGSALINSSTAWTGQANSSCPPTGDKKRLAWGIKSVRRALIRQGMVASARLMQASTGNCSRWAGAVFSNRLKYKNGVTNAADRR